MPKPDNHFAELPDESGSDSVRVIRDIKRWFAELDQFNDEPFMLGGRRQPEMPPIRSEP